MADRSGRNSPRETTRSRSIERSRGSSSFRTLSRASAYPLSRRRTRNWSATSRRTTSTACSAVRTAGMYSSRKRRPTNSAISGLFSVSTPPLFCLSTLTPKDPGFCRSILKRSSPLILCPSSVWKAEHSESVRCRVISTEGFAPGLSRGRSRCGMKSTTSPGYRRRAIYGRAVLPMPSICEVATMAARNMFDFPSLFAPTRHVRSVSGTSAVSILLKFLILNDMTRTEDSKPFPGRAYLRTRCRRSLLAGPCASPSPGRTSGSPGPAPTPGKTVRSLIALLG